MGLWVKSGKSGDSKVVVEVDDDNDEGKPQKAGRRAAQTN